MELDQKKYNLERVRRRMESIFNHMRDLFVDDVDVPDDLLWFFDDLEVKVMEIVTDREHLLSENERLKTANVSSWCENCESTEKENERLKERIGEWRAIAQSAILGEKEAKQDYINLSLIEDKLGDITKEVGDED